MASTAAELKSVADAWDIISSSLQNISWEEASNIPVVYQNAVGVLYQHGISNIICEWYLETIKRNLQENFVPRFWSFFNKENSINELIFSDAVQYLHSQMLVHNPALERLELTNKLISSLSSDDSYKEYVFNAAKLYLRAVLFAQKPLNFEIVIESFYMAAFKAFSGSDEKDKNDSLSHCNGCNQDLSSCRCQKVLELFHTVNQQLYELGLLEQLAGRVVTTIIHEHIEHHVMQTCKGNFESSYIGMLEKWLDASVVSWLVKVYRGNEESTRHNDAHILETIGKFTSQLHHLLYSTYAHTRMDQLFSVIIEFPESQPAVEDLRDCLERTNLRSKLIQSLKETLETKLLHPGVNTADILTAYVSAIKALRILDTTGVILELVCEPVRKYLRTRQDTIREIIFALIDDTSSDLTDELFRARPLVLDENYNSDEELENWETWQPDPVDADPGKPSQTRRSSDIISMLVNIYGSKELFINEYRNLLADRIITTFNYDTGREIRYLELLKLKFGEANLHYCEVMLKDVADSRRINFHIHSDDVAIYDPKDCNVNAMILSAQFWPTFREEKLELPPFIKKSLDEYTRAFETLKGNRTLSWKHHLGLVSLNIELKDRTLKLAVSPVHAVIIMQFENKERWSISELSTATHVPSTVIRRKIMYWQSRGVLQEETRDTFSVLEELKNGATADAPLMDEEDDEEESVMASSHDQREEEMQVFWSYIVGMLTNLESLPLDRIHTMLRMFAMQGPTAVECSVRELKHFLDRKVREQKLFFSGGMYRLPRHNT